MCSNEANKDIFSDTFLSSDSNLSVTSYNRILLWEISDISFIKGMHETSLFYSFLIVCALDCATWGEQKSIYSSSFYIFPKGYKMCLRLFMNGDSTARGSHISLFLVNMRGEYDGVLQWPLHLRVTFSLIDQLVTNYSLCDINQICRSETREMCFNRPNFNIDSAYGSSRFFPLDLFEENRTRYIQNDTSFIKLDVKLLSESLSISFSLNVHANLSFFCQMHHQQLMRPIHYTKINLMVQLMTI